MAVEIITEDRRGYSLSVLACNTSDVAFGPLMYIDRDRVEDFLHTLGVDPRSLSADDLSHQYYTWLADVEVPR